MNIEIKPGTLCYIRGAQGLDAINNGRVVEAIRRLESAPEIGHAPAWEAKSSSNIFARLPVWPAQYLDALPGTVLIVRESLLVPIAGPGLEDEVTAFDKKVGYKSIAELDAAFGARSIPHVGR